MLTTLTLTTFLAFGGPVQPMPTAFATMPSMPGGAIRLDLVPILPPQDVACPGCGVDTAFIIDVYPGGLATWATSSVVNSAGSCTMQDPDLEDPNNPLQCLPKTRCSSSETVDIDMVFRVATHYSVNLQAGTLAPIKSWPIRWTFDAEGECDGKPYQSDSLQLWIGTKFRLADLMADIRLRVICKKCDD